MPSTSCSNWFGRRALRAYRKFSTSIKSSIVERESLVIPLLMGVRREFSKGRPQAPLPERNEAVQAFFLH
jgi:hypothetical protein